MLKELYDVHTTDGSTLSFLGSEPGESLFLFRFSLEKNLRQPLKIAIERRLTPPVICSKSSTKLMFPFVNPIPENIDLICTCFYRRFRSPNGNKPLISSRSYIIEFLSYARVFEESGSSYYFMFLYRAWDQIVEESKYAWSAAKLYIPVTRNAPSEGQTSGTPCVWHDLISILTSKLLCELDTTLSHAWKTQGRGTAKTSPQESEQPSPRQPQLIWAMRMQMTLGHYR